MLDNWLKEYLNNIETLSHQEKLEEIGFDKLKDLVKHMFLSPLDYGDYFYELKFKIELAE